MKIEKKDFAEIPDYIHDTVKAYIKEENTTDDKDILIAQYFDMIFRTGWEMAKQTYNK